MKKNQKRLPLHECGGMTITVDPLALPLCGARGTNTSSRSFSREPKMGAGEKMHQERMDSLARRAGIR